MLWNELLIGLAGGAFGSLATIIGILFKSARAYREDWWNRFGWASDAYVSPDANMRAAAREVLADLSQDRRARKQDRKMAAALLKNRVELHIAGSQSSEVKIKI